MPASGKETFQKIRRNRNNLAIFPQILCRYTQLKNVIRDVSIATYLQRMPAKKLDAMTWEQMQSVVDNAEEFCKTYGRLPYFYITGGDPILHPDFWKLMDLLKEKKIPFTILGNPNAVYACINYGEAQCSSDIRDRSICIDGDIGQVLDELV